jgi:AraC family transcriptional regulator
MNHWHAKANFCIAVEGGSIEQYGTKTREFRPLTASFLPAEQLHSLTFQAKPMRCFAIDVGPESLQRAAEFCRLTDNSVHSHQGRLSETFLRLYYEFREMDEASALAIEGLLFEMLAMVSRDQTDPEDRFAPKWLKRVRDLVHADFGEQLSLTQIATEAGVHPVHLAREFRKHYRATFGEYLRQVRVNYASQQLLTSDEPPAMIAAAAGFADQSHFSRTFKRLRGTTPGKFRAAFKLDESFASQD